MPATLFDGMTTEYVKAQAVEKAQEVRAQHQMSCNTPADLNFIAQHAGIIISRTDLGNHVDAQVTVNKRSFSIDLNKTRHLVRYRLALAQGLGYILAHYPELGVQENTRYQKWTALLPGENEEAYRNSIAGIHGQTFAKEILMPEIMIANMVKESESIISMAATLALPVNTVSARVQELGHDHLMMQSTT